MTEERSKSPVWIMRLLAITNLLLVTYGILLIAQTAYNVHRYRSIIPVPWPYWWMTAINFLFLSALAYASLLLWRLRPRGLILSLVIFVTETFYFFAGGVIWAFHGPFSRAVAGASGIGDMGIAPQILTGYPVVAGVIAAMLLRSSKRQPLIANA